MHYSEQQLAADIENINRIPIVSTLLNVVCETTGMRFAAIARVTEDRWIACSVRDDIQFGLQTGSELKIETTICNEIRDSREAVIIDHVAESEQFCGHPTPKLYGFQSYISMPILLQDGSFFGTLCAIDPAPNQLKNERVTGLFKLFAELISFHLESQRMMEQSHVAVRELNRNLTYSLDENRQYSQISNHHLKEPLRKMRMFSGMLVEAMEKNDLNKAKILAQKIDNSAERFSLMLKELSDYAALSEGEDPSERVDLNDVAAAVRLLLRSELARKGTTLRINHLPVVRASPKQTEALFYQLITYLLLRKPTAPSIINIFANDPLPNEVERCRNSKPQYVEIFIGGDATLLNKNKSEGIFDLFAKESSEADSQDTGNALAYCRKIVHRHGGMLTAYGNGQEETMTFYIALPSEKTSHETTASTTVTHK